MSHDLETVSGVTFFADSRNDAWHQLGQQVGHEMTVAEAMEFSHLGGWNVRKNQLIVPAEVDEHGVHTEIVVPDQYSVVRTNPVTGNREYLGTVGEVYHPIQNEEHAAFLQTLVDEFGANLETAGSLGNGRDVFITMKLPHTMEIVGSNGNTDKTEWYLAALNNHTGKSSFRVLLTPVRVVCRNTQQWAISSAKSSWKVRHTETATSRIAAAREVLGIAWKSIDSIDAEFQRMAEIPVSFVEAKQFTDDLLNVDKVDPDSTAATKRRNSAGQILKLFVESPTIRNVADTRYGLYNAVTEYVDHYQSTRSGSDDDSAKANARAVRTIRDAENPNSLKAQAFTLLRVPA